MKVPQDDFKSISNPDPLVSYLVTEMNLSLSILIGSIEVEITSSSTRSISERPKESFILIILIFDCLSKKSFAFVSP